MTLVLNGTTGVSSVDGSASTPAIQGTDSNTGVFFPAADTVAIATGGTERVRVNGSGDFQFNSGYGSVATAYACRAWVNFNGTGTVAIRASGNVSSITDNGTGDYTVNFTTALVDANYSLGGMAGVNNTSLRSVMQPFNLQAPTTTQVRIQVPSADGSLVTDAPFVSVTVFR